MIRYTFLFVLLFIGAVGFVGCQTFAPEYDANVTSTKKIKTNRNKVGFFESAKNLFLPDFDNENENDTENLKVASRKSESPKQQTQSKPAQKYAFGNSLSTNPQQNNISLNPNLLPPSFSPYFVNNINTNLTSQQNDLVTKNTSPITPTSNDTANISEQIAQNKDVVDKNTDVLTGVASSKNFVETAKADSETTTVAKTEPNKTQTIKKYAVDSLLPQSGDSEKFRSFLKELAEIPADQLKVDETELVDRITAFREECRVIKNPKIEMVALDYLREDILPDFLTDKKIQNKENTVAVSKPISTSNKKNNLNPKRKLDFEQAAFSEQHDNQADDLYCNDNSDDKNAPLPADVRPTDKKKQRLSSIPSRGFESENYHDSASTQSQQLPTLPQLKTLQSSTFSQNNFPNENRFDNKFAESKFVSYLPNQSGNVINANYSASNQNTNYPINPQQQLSNQTDNWEMQVRNAITSLRREMETSSVAKTFSNEVKLRLLELSVGNRGEAMKQFGTAEKPVNEFWTNQILGLSTIMDELVIPNHTSRYDAALLRFDESTTALRQVCPLRLKNVQLIQQDNLEAHYISSFGNYQTRSEECKPSEIIAIYLELENPTIKSSSQGYTIRLSVDCEILDTNSKVVQKEENKIVEDLSTVQKHDHFIKMLVELKRKLPHGYYKLRIRVTDLNSHDSQKTAEEQIPIRIMQ
ncbi:MAG: hypothetical protein LBH59_04475 [Planctomycetaceae bacterium]|nr:hypothetical protein [Planctomycetaceae bacterium]